MARNRMQFAADRLMAQFEDHASELVTYVSGTIVITDVPATIGRTPYDTVRGDVVIAEETRDFIIRAWRLQYEDIAMTPASGDQITDAAGRTWEVSMPGGAYVFERLGPDGSVLKIHTKMVVASGAVIPPQLRPDITQLSSAPLPDVTLYVPGQGLQFTDTQQLFVLMAGSPNFWQERALVKPGPDW